MLFTGADRKQHAVRLGKLPVKAVELIKTKIEALNAAAVAQMSLDRETANWVGTLDAKLYDKLAAVGLVPMRQGAECATLELFIDRYVAKRPM